MTSTATSTSDDAWLGPLYRTLVREIHLHGDLDGQPAGFVVVESRAGAAQYRGEEAKRFLAAAAKYVPHVPVRRHP